MRDTVTSGFRLPTFIAFALLVLGTSAAAQHHDHHGAHMGARDLSHASPGSVGVSAERLERLAAGMQQMVDDGKLAGVVTMMARHGRTVFSHAAGVLNVDSDAPAAEDSIFLIYSMTKPVTGVAMMMLYEEGKWRLNDPVSKYIPEFADLKVYVGEAADGSPVLEDATRSMTMRELMTHSGGLDYGLSARAPVGQMYQDAGVINFYPPDASEESQSFTLQSLIDTLADLPLRSQPGTGYFYSIGVDVQGYLVEKLSGQPFDEFLLNRVFEPLGMGDTGFFVPVGSLGRAARIHAAGDDGELELAAGSNMLIDGTVRTQPPAGPSGGGGLYSTAGDYLKFSQMLLNGGELGGVRLLSPRTVDMMRTNHLLPEPLATMPQGRGFGLDFGVAMDAAAVGEPYADGTYFWGGAAGTWFWIDPVTDVVFVGMIQHFGAAAGDVQGLSRNLTYQAIVH